MAKRVVNFNPGPAALPLEVLKIVQEELLDYQGSGMSILESSHRAKEFEAVNDQAMALVHEILGLGADYQVLFMGGGASTQFALVPMNFIPAGGTAAYVDTGEFAFKAMKEAQIVAKAHVAFSSKAEKYRPRAENERNQISRRCRLSAHLLEQYHRRDSVPRVSGNR